jgi:aryl-alcohol dehydrogenase-like predicted oxidoreductase
VKDIPGLSPLGLGASRIGSFNNPSSLKDSQRLVKAALNMGVSVLDTSNIYGQGDSERTIGRAIRGNRDKVFVITKAGRLFSGKYRAMKLLKPMIRPLLKLLGKGSNIATARRQDALAADWTPQAIARSLDQSLRRLRTSYVDGFLLHSPPPEIAGDDNIASTLAGLKAQGKVRHYGVSCDDAATLVTALQMPGIGMVQLPWDVIQAESAVIDTLRARNIIVIAREVISMQSAIAPVNAVQNALTHPGIDCVLIGTTKLDHLRAFVR